MKGQLEIHSQNILPIIKKWLYSDKDIFVRELVSNSCDACQKVKFLRDQGKVEAKDEDFRIDVKIDKDKKTITFSDNGVGMDAEEVQKYIAQIAFSGAEDFVAQYQTGNEKDQFIGHFGLGFYSAYMVAGKVEIDTLSYKEGAEPVLWINDGSAEYTLEKGSRTSRGTDITLFVNSDSEDYLEESKLRSILKKYCSFLPYPIYFNDSRINPDEPLWIKNPSNCTEKDYLDFYKKIEPFAEDPLFWIHLNVDYPFHLKGILYFPKMKRDIDLNKSTIQLYSNRVFVSDNCKDIVPDYLMALRGVIDSPDIPLNVSRSYLQMDKTVRQLSSHISKKVSDSLTVLFKTDREKYEKTWEDISTFVKLGAVQDDKFYDRMKEIFLFKSINGNYLTLPELLEKGKEKIYYSIHGEESEALKGLYKDKEIVICKNPIDPYFIASIEKHNESVQFKRVDSDVEEHLIDADKEKTVIDENGKTEAAHLADFVRSVVKDPQIEVEAKSLKTNDIPCLIVMDESERRFRDYMAQMHPDDSKGALKAMKRKMVVNTNSPLMQSIKKLETSNPDLAQNLVHEVFDLALISSREMDANDLRNFLGRTQNLIEELASIAANKS